MKTKFVTITEGTNSQTGVQASFQCFITPQCWAAFQKEAELFPPRSDQGYAGKLIGDQFGVRIAFEYNASDQGLTGFILANTNNIPQCQIEQYVNSVLDKAATSGGVPPVIRTTGV